MKKFVKLSLALFAGCLWLFFVVEAFGGVPLETVRGHVNEVLNILKNPAYKGDAGKTAKREKIRAISDMMFDFGELSKRTLGVNWNAFTTAQRREFIELYRGLLEDAYVDKITSYTDEKIIYGKELPLSENAVEVQSIIVTKGAEIPVHYRMLSKGGQWRVYDVVIEGVSLVNNYRSQFREILANGTPETLIKRLREKRVQRK